MDCDKWEHYSCHQEIARLRRRLAEAEADLEASQNHVRLISGIADGLRAEANARLTAAAPLLLAALNAASGNIDDSRMSLDAYSNLMRQIDAAIDAAEGG